MSKIILLVFLSLLLSISAQTVYANHKISLIKDTKPVDSIKEGETVDISTYLCNATENVKFSYIYPGITRAIILGNIQAPGGVAVLSPQFTQPVNITQPVVLTIFTECSGHTATSSLTLTPNRDLSTPPTKLRVSGLPNSVTDNSVRIVWEVLPRSTYYQVWYRTPTEPDYNKTSVDPTTTDFVVTGLKSGTKYLIHINGCNETACSSASDDISVNTNGLDVSGGTCTLDLSKQPYVVKENGCTSPNVPTNAGNLFAPQCACKPPGSGSEIPAALGGAVNIEYCRIDRKLDELPFCDQFIEQRYQLVAKAGGCTLGKQPGWVCKEDVQILCINSSGSRSAEVVTCAAPPKISAAGQTCTGPEPGLLTAIGCINTQPAKLVGDVLRFLLGIGGGIAFLLMLFGVFQMITSAGNPQTLKEGQDRFTSAVIGLLMVVFSVLLLQIIGVDILNIPGFT